MRAERHADEASRLRKIHVVKLLVQFLRKQLSKLVLESLTLLVRERKVARIGADPQHLGIDELDREVKAAIAGLGLRVVTLRPRHLMACRRCSDRERDQQAAMD